MAKIIPPPPRARVTDNGQGLRVLVPARRDVFISLLWFVGWVFAEVMALRTLLSGKESITTVLFVALWLCAWTVCGACFLFILFWSRAGREEIVVGGDTFSVRYALFSAGKTWNFDRNTVRNMRLGEGGVPLQASRKNPTGVWSGPLAFDYGAKTFRFGAGLDEAEARDLLPLLLRRRLLPQNGR